MKKKYVYMVLCIIWMGIIFWFSAQPADDSTTMSNGVIAMLEEFFHIDMLHEGNLIYDTVSFLVRKAAHMSEYAILGMLVYGYVREARPKQAFWIAFGVVCMYACSDEFHQLFVPGRTGKWMDVGIDTLGGFLGLSLQQLYLYIRTNIRKKHG